MAKGNCKQCGAVTETRGKTLVKHFCNSVCNQKYKREEKRQEELKRLGDRRCTVCNADIKIVNGHYPMFSNGNYGNDNKLSFVELLSANTRLIDCVLNYGRIQPEKNGILELRWKELETKPI